MNALPDDELTWPYIQRFLALRAAKRIGPVWPGANGVYWLAPADAFDPWSQLGPIAVPKLREMIDALDPPQIQPETTAPAVARKEVESARGTWFVEMRRRA